MKRLTGAAAMAALLWSAPALAQVGSLGGERKWSLGLVGGAGAVQKVGALAGLTLGVAVSDKLDIVGDGLWSSNAATRRRLDLISNLAGFVQDTQLGPTSGTITAPAFYAGGGVRVPFKRSGNWRPYIVVTGGVARVVLRPEIVLSGGDITSRLPQFGITLGSDLTGVLTKPAISGGFGVRSARGRYYIDVGLRLINIQTEGQATRVIGATGALGFSL